MATFKKMTCDITNRYAYGRSIDNPDVVLLPAGSVGEVQEVSGDGSTVRLLFSDKSHILLWVDAADTVAAAGVQVELDGYGPYYHVGIRNLETQSRMRIRTFTVEEEDGNTRDTYLDAVHWAQRLGRQLTCDVVDFVNEEDCDEC